MAKGDEHYLYFLDFADKGDHSPCIPGLTGPLEQIQQELFQYFSGALTEFKTPLACEGTPFQKRVWGALQKIPFGVTRSYAEVAVKVENPKGYRAVAQANKSNQMVIIIPCHRVIYASGALGGYAGGLERKKWLLAHEKR